MDVHRVRTRFWIEVAACGVALLLTVLALVRRDWIEALLPVEPDGGSGELEWLLAAVALAVAIACGVVARLEWRRSGPTAAAQSAAQS